MKLRLEKLSLKHIKVLTVTEIAALFSISREEAYRIKKNAEKLKESLLPLVAVGYIAGEYKVYFPHGLNLVWLPEFKLKLDPSPYESSDLLDEEYLRYLLLDLPRLLDRARKPVLILEPNRFTRNEAEGLEYSLYILARIAYVYKIPVVLFTEDKKLYEELRKRKEFVQVFP